MVPEKTSEQDELDVGRMALRLWECRKWLLLCAVVSGIAFAAVAFLTRPIYRASTVMVPAASDNSSLGSALSSGLGQLGGLASLVGVGAGDSGVVTEEALAVMRSTRFMRSFIEEQNIMPALYPNKWDAANGKWKGPPDKQPRIERAIKRFVTTISSVDQNKKTGLVTMRIDFGDRQQAALWANALVAKLNEEMRSRAVAKADASVGYLRKELAETAEVGTREAINRLLESQIKQRMMANVTREYAFRIVDSATPPEADDILRPNRLLLLATGPLLGLVLGALGALLLTTKKSSA